MLIPTALMENSRDFTENRNDIFIMSLWGLNFHLINEVFYTFLLATKFFVPIFLVFYIIFFGLIYRGYSWSYFSHLFTSAYKIQLPQFFQVFVFLIQNLVSHSIYFFTTQMEQSSLSNDSKKPFTSPIGRKQNHNAKSIAPSPQFNYYNRSIFCI